MSQKQSSVSQCIGKKGTSAGVFLLAFHRHIFLACNAVPSRLHKLVKE